VAQSSSLIFGHPVLKVRAYEISALEALYLAADEVAASRTNASNAIHHPRGGTG
jgi:hypothetical protein